MSMSIDTNKVTAVHLDDGWHTVLDGSFEVGGYEINDAGVIIYTRSDHGIRGEGFRFTTQDESERTLTLTGPLDSVLAMEVDA